MTPEEALKDIIESGINLGAGDYVKFDTLKVAAAALEKQVPKKYISIDSPYKGQCPVCHVTVWLNSGYCWKCGQAIDWSEEE